jgi:dihydroorotate dehydrogenase (NAD+) catalytic subunit
LYHVAFFFQGSALTGKGPAVKPDMTVDLCGIQLRNPVIAASGTFGYGVEFESILDLNRLGAIVVKGLSREPIAGNPPPRLWETAEGMINSVGLQNMGVAEFIKQKLPKLRRFQTPVIANVFGYAVDDYCEVVRILEDADGITAYELNVSCPNTKCGGIQFSSDPAMLASVVAPVRRLAKRPVIVKLSPNVAAIEPLAQAAETAGADAISLVNTFVALSVDARTRRPRIGNGLGGLSGPAIKPIALRMVWQAARSVRIPVIGLGGIGTGEDAAEFMVAGATAVQVGTASFWDPRATTRIARQLESFCRRNGITAVRELTGTLKM